MKPVIHRTFAPHQAVLCRDTTTPRRGTVDREAGTGRYWVLVPKGPDPRDTGRVIVRADLMEAV